MRFMICSGAILLAAGAAVAQEHFQIQLAQPMEGATRAGFVRMLSPSQIVKGSPYSADAVTETRQVLADGNRIVNRAFNKQYRDSEGRERRELSLPDLPGIVVGNDSMQTVLITDPVAGVSYSLNPKAKTADKLTMPSVQVEEAADVHNTVHGAHILIQATTAAGAAQFGGKDVMVYNDRQVMAQVNGNLSAKEEDLGTATIEGVVAQGKRTRTVIPAGQMGNEKDLEIVGETWYSPELKMTVMTKRSDPRAGETVFKLTNISRAEPARGLFEAPADYTVNAPVNAVPGQRIQIIQREIHPH